MSDPDAGAPALTNRRHGATMEGAELRAESQAAAHDANAGGGMQPSNEITGAHFQPQRCRTSLRRRTNGHSFCYAAQTTVQGLLGKVTPFSPAYTHFIPPN